MARWYKIARIILGASTSHQGLNFRDRLNGDFLNERVTKPLGMIHTRLGSNDAVVPNRVTGYELDAATGSVPNARYRWPEDLGLQVDVR